MSHHTTVTDPRGRIRQVKNLGWLLRNWQSIEEIIILPPPKRLEKHWDVMMHVRMSDDSMFETPWADRSVLWSWLDRPILRDVALCWMGQDMKIFKGQSNAVSMTFHKWTERCPSCAELVENFFDHVDGSCLHG